MFRDGKPDHESPAHARYKMELAAKAEVVLREQLARAQPEQVAQKPEE